MLKNILVPTDGTELSARAAAYAVGLAKQAGAKVTAVTVTTPAEGILLGDGATIRNKAAYEERSQAFARTALGRIEQLAKDAGVGCESVHSREDQPWQGIINTASSKGADLIVIASHGRRGLSALMIGSETQKVVNHSKIPVLVYR
jgi:nucleotide-binding universal stress UspA family protein